MAEQNHALFDAPYPDAPPHLAQKLSPDIYVVAAHPNWRESRVNLLLLQAARQEPRAQVRDLYASYPDYAIDVPAEQVALKRAQLVVLLHPIQWYSMPALQKLWLDDVLTFGWAYGVGDDATPGNALRGKDLWLVASTGGPEASYQPDSYNRYSFDAFLPPYAQTATLCGMRFLPPLILHGAHRASSETLQAHSRIFADRLRTYPNWPELNALSPCCETTVPGQDRPDPNDMKSPP